MSGAMICTFLCVADQYPFAVSGDDVPYPNGTVIASGDECASTSSERANRVVVTLEVKFMVRVIVDILLRIVTLAVYEMRVTYHNCTPLKGQLRYHPRHNICTLRLRVEATSIPAASDPCYR